MKSLIDVLAAITQDLGDVCGVQSTDRDLKTVRDRVKQEGESFLTITLPTFAKSLEQALDRGTVVSTDFLGFAKRASGLPHFCGGFLDLVFDSTGSLLPDPSADAIRAVRQICLLFGKIQRECSDVRTRAAFASYLECENDLRALVLDDLDDLRRVFLVLFGDLMHNVSRKIDECALLPKHGPGSTADRLQGNQKWNQAEWTRRLERSFPIDSYLIPNHRYWEDLGRVKIVEPRNERPVKVISVPKTLKTPRIIAVEPTCMQYAQQALLAAISEEIHADSLLYGLVGLDDQSPNRDLALSGSRNGHHATLDLSEASDRVSNQLVYNLTRPYASFRNALQDSRSQTADVPGIGIIPLAKFASMGSAVCFPIEGMVFSAISVLGVLRQRRDHVRSSAIRRAAEEVRVFGDDIIVPTDSAERVVSTLELYGLKVNRGKSFWTGKFRESCGGDYYDGTDVSIHRFRREIPTTRFDARGVASLFSFRNQCYNSGYWKAARLVDRWLESFRIPLPRVSDTSPVLGRLSFLGYETQRYDRNLHSPRVKGLQIRSRPPASPLGDVGALQKIFVLKRNEPLFDGHLERLGRPDLVRTKIGWGSPF